MNEVAERFGANLARARRRVRLSQEEVAVRACLHRTEIGHLEHGRRLPRIDTAVKLAAAVEAEIGELVEGIGWVGGECRAGAFVMDSQRQPAASQSSSQPQEPEHQHPASGPDTPRHSNESPISSRT